MELEMTRPMRIVLLSPHFAEYSFRLANELSRDASVLLIVDSRNRRHECDDGLYKKVTADTRVIEFEFSSRMARVYWTVHILLRVLAFRPDVYHAHERADRTCSRITRILGFLFPTVLTVHDPKPHSGVDAATYGRKEAIYSRRTRAAATVFHVHGEFCRGQIKPDAGKRRVIATQHGVILVPEPCQLKEPVPGRILLFGRMEAYKGIEVLLQASEELNRRGVDHQMVFAGKGTEMGRIVAASRANRSVEVIQKYLTPTDAILEFQQASIIVAPYLDATQSGVVAAAFGNERPVVASRAGGLVDSIQHGVNGILVEPGDPIELAEALEGVLSRPAELRTLSGGAKEAARGEFNWRNIALTLMEVYRTLRR
jgi:glycosyltransferase involved in cell wall biosynthesis